MDRVNARSVALRALIVTVLFCGLGYLAVRLVPGAGERLAHAGPGWLAAGVAVEMVACAGFALCFWACFSYAPYLVTRSRSAQVALGELAAFALVPTGAAAPLLRFWALARGGMPVREIAVRSVPHAVLLNVPYIGAATLLGAGVVAGIGPGDAPLVVALSPIFVIAGTLLIALWLVALGRRQRPDARGRLARVLRELVTIIPEGIRAIPGRARVPGATGGASVYWVCDCAVLWIAFGAIGTHPSLAVIALGYMLGQVGTALPLPGGVGGVEPIMLGVLTASGVATAPAAAAIVIYRAVSLGVQSALGAGAVGLLVPAVRAMRSVPPGS